MCLESTRGGLKDAPSGVEGTYGECGGYPQCVWWVPATCLRGSTACFRVCVFGGPAECLGVSATFFHEFSQLESGCPQLRGICDYYSGLNAAVFRIVAVLDLWEKH